MKNIFILVLTILLLPIATWAQTVNVEELGHNQLGRNMVRANPSAFTGQHLDSFSADGDTTITLDFPESNAGEAFRFVFKSGDTIGAVADTLWKYFPTQAAATDSLPYISLPGMLTPFDITVKEGDAIRISQRTTGGDIWCRVDAVGVTN